jgi:membrane associated rhomboid family serine protease
MVQAAVGFQCPDCTHARPQRVVSSRQLFAGSGSSDVIVGKVLIGINVAAYVLMVLVGGSASQAQGEVFERGVTWGPSVASGEWWRLVSGAFLHASPLHLLMNMFLLYLLSRELEPAIGHVRFLLVYVVSLLGGALGVMLVSPDAATLGASGAIFGLMGALVVLQLRAKQNPWNSGLGLLIVINLVITFLNPEISVGGHIGGLVAGAVAGLLVTPLRWPQENAMVKDGFIALIGIGFAVAAVLAAQALASPLPLFS